MYLVDILQKVRDRINQHGASLRTNEMLTRYALIDPVLRALGWDTEDPDIVVPEYTTATGRIDYVLFWNNQMYIALEAKALWSGLASARKTGFQYCWSNGIPFYLISDGDTWELYDMTVLSGKLILNLQIYTATHLGHAAYDLLRLHRALMPLYVSAPSATTTGTPPSGSLGSPSASAVPPTVSPSPGTGAISPSASAVAPAVSPSPGTGAISPPATVPPTASTASGRASLDYLHRQGCQVTGKRPKQVIFPGKSSAALSTWKDFLIETIKYLDSIGKLPPPPYSHGRRGKSYLYNTTPTHPGGRQMRSPTMVRTLHGKIYVETHRSAIDLCQAVYELVSKAGISPNSVMLDLV
ncbi:MAG: hypothetical protein KatS3mg019_0941 [Fimbriimonadales bacterium]|nr:MAG: hypothetical protein KatS3mg019_0941 [Fimbriimonadales bacterium]